MSSWRLTTTASAAPFWSGCSILLGLCGQEARDTPMVQQLIELLDDLDVQAYWGDQEAPFPEAAMFAILKGEDHTKRRAKPCLANGQEGLLKGIKFTDAEA